MEGIAKNICEETGNILRRRLFEFRSAWICIVGGKITEPVFFNNNSNDGSGGVRGLFLRGLFPAVNACIPPNEKTPREVIQTSHLFLLILDTPSDCCGNTILPSKKIKHSLYGVYNE